MGQESFFLVVPATEERQVREHWDKYCELDKKAQRLQAVQFWIDEGDPVDPNDEKEFNLALAEFVAYNGSAWSFDDYKFHFREAPQEWADSELKLREWILQVHDKWTPAIAVRLEQQTLIGGWVPV